MFGIIEKIGVPLYVDYCGESRAVTMTSAKRRLGGSLGTWGSLERCKFHVILR